MQPKGQVINEGGNPMTHSSQAATISMFTIGSAAASSRQAGAATFGTCRKRPRLRPDYRDGRHRRPEALAEEYMVIVGAGGAGPRPPQQGKVRRAAREAPMTSEAPTALSHLGDHRPGRGRANSTMPRNCSIIGWIRPRVLCNEGPGVEGDEPDQRHPLVARGHGCKCTRQATLRP